MVIEYIFANINIILMSEHSINAEDFPRNHAYLWL